MKNIAGIMADAVEENFEQEGRPDKWQELAESTIKHRKKTKHWPGKILQVEGQLATSITTQYDNESAVIGSNLAYAAIHQLGGQAGKGKKVTIPARPSVWLLNLIENILSITKFDTNEIKINKESEFISDIIEEALSHLGRKKENYILQTEIEDESLSVEIDAQLITQVIFNLVDNAMKYSPLGTKIIITAKERAEKVEISVADEGNGIENKDKEKIFDAFYTCNNSSIDSRRGLGLGLALCKTIIEAHGGNIEIKDNYPKGTIFSFSLNRDNNVDFTEGNYE